MRHAAVATLMASAFVVGLAQSSSADRSSRTVTLTGCLRPGDVDGTFLLTNVREDRRGTHTGRMMGKDTVPLTPSGDVDLKPLVLHKVQVKGTLGVARTAGDAHPSVATPPASSNPATASQPDTNPSTQATTGQSRTKKGNRTSDAAAGGPRTLTVTSAKTIAATCGE
jgi:hypothetical protein